MQKPTIPIETFDGNDKNPDGRNNPSRAMSQLDVPTPTAPPTPEDIVTPPPPSTSPGPAADKTAPTPPKEKTYTDLHDDFVQLVASGNPLTNRQALTKSVKALLLQVLKEHPVSQNYRILLMYDNITLIRQDADKIYRALSALKDTNKPIALIIHSGGGEVDAAYLISKLCREFSPENFITIVPRRAKSAATLICCGADQIHMGSMSELGPIDPQFDGMPALGLKYAIQHLLDLAGQYPKAADVLAKYLESSLKLINLGYYERVAESATQYAERLLKRRKITNSVNLESIAKTLVYSYSDHEFVIDTGEAEDIFGPGVIVSNSQEYNMANALYSALSSVESMFDAVGFAFYLYGSVNSPPNFYRKKS